MRGGLGARIGREATTYRLSDLDRGALRLLVDAVRPLTRPLLLAVAATLAGAGLGAAAPLLVRWAIDVHIAGSDLAGLAMVIAGYTGLQVALWWTRYWQRYLTELVGQDIVVALRGRLFGHLQRLGMDFFERRPVGELISRLTGDVNAVAEVVTTGSLSLIGDLAAVILIAGVMLVLDVRLALVALVLVPVVLMSTVLFARSLRAAYARVRERSADLDANVQENLAGMRVVQSLGQERASMERFEQVNLYNLRANMHAMLVFALFFPLMTVTANLGTAAILGYGGGLVAGGGLSLGTLVAFISYMRSFFHPLRELSQVLNTVQAAAASLDRIHGVLSVPPTIVEPAQPGTPSEIRGAVEFRDVVFGYGRGAPVFDGLSLDLRAGEVLAVVGPSGAGKTTLVSLLARLYDVEEGAVLVDGVDVRCWSLDALRRTVAVVPQEAGLFPPGTVLDNITYGAPGATRQDVQDLARMMGVDGVIDSLPQGLDTRIGPAAAGRISGGQRQVIAVLRAVLPGPRILILDEATSNVDGRTEAMINAGLARALDGRTGIVIAHRLRAVGLATRILVLDGGRVVDSGRHRDLLARCSLYRDLWESQDPVS